MKLVTGLLPVLHIKLYTHVIPVMPGSGVGEPPTQVVGVGTRHAGVRRRRWYVVVDVVVALVPVMPGSGVGVGT